MRRSRIWIAVILIVLVVPLGRAKECTLTNAEIIKMSEAGLSDDVILGSMRGCQVHFDLSTDGLVDLKGHRVSDVVVRAMQNPSPIVPAAAAPPTAPTAEMAPKAPVQELGFFVVLKSGDIIKAKNTTTTSKGSGGRLAADVLVPFAAFARHKHKTTIPGIQAELRFKADAIDHFIYYTSPGTPVDSQFLRLVKAEVDKDKELRQLGATMTSATGGQKQEEAALRLVIKVSNVPGLYELRTESSLASGEYAIIYGQFGQERTFGIKDVWDFGID